MIPTNIAQAFKEFSGKSVQMFEIKAILALIF